MQCFMKKEDTSLVDVENVETTGERCCHLSSRTPLNSSLCTFIGVKHISPTFVYTIPMYLRLTTFTKTLPQRSFPLKQFYFSALTPMTLLTAGALTDPHLPATASIVCTTDVRLGGVGWVPPPNKNPGYAGAHARTYAHTNTHTRLVLKCGLAHLNANA